MNQVPGGATARPFETYHNDLKLKLYMRVAPELYLKQLIVGGMNRVFEIGKNFRNESIDTTHNPEFTACEFYWAYADYEDLMAMTEDLLSKMVYAIHGKYEIEYENSDPAIGKIKINFAKPFRRVSLMSELKKQLGDKAKGWGMEWPANKDLSKPETREFFDKLIVKLGVDCSAPRSTARLIDKLVGEYIETTCKDPCFIMDTPQLMSPLAKWHRDEEGLSERFELFANFHELINAYTELNDPKVQAAAFQGQAAAKDDGDVEAQGYDKEFIQALEYGLPPTGGWGLGVDRITMLLTNSQNIKEVLLFPAMKPEDQPGNEAAEEAQPKAVANAPAKAASSSSGKFADSKGTLYISDSSNSGQSLCLIVNNMLDASHKSSIEFMTEDEFKKDKDLEKKSLFGEFPFVKSSDGSFISQGNATASHLARSQPSLNLFGSNSMQEAQVHQWLSWSEEIASVVRCVICCVQGHGKCDMKTWNEKLGQVKGWVKTMNNHLNGKNWLVGSSMTLADIACGVLFTECFQLVLDSGFRKSMPNVTKWFQAFAANSSVIASCGMIKCADKCIKPPCAAGDSQESAAKKGGKKEKVETKKAAKEDDLDDLFGDDDVEDENAAKEIAAKAKAKAAEAKKPKKVVIAQSLVLFEVKPLSDETDLDAMAKDILAIKQDGLYWKTEYKKVPIAFGIFKIIIGVTVEDEKVSIDALQEQIEAIEDKVQSVEILAFNKI